MVQIIGGVTDGDWPTWGDLGTQLGIGREHTVESYEVVPGAWYEGGQPLHEFDRRHNDVGGAILIRALSILRSVNGTSLYHSSVAVRRHRHC